MSYREHAMEEFRAAGWVDENGNWEDEMQELMCNQVMELLDVFSEHGHSGTSAPYAIDLFSKLASWKIITPLTGKDEEWIEHDKVIQNNRFSAVFKDKKTGNPYFLDAIVWKGEEDYDTFTGMVEDIRSSQNITFPFTPKTFYIDVYKVYYTKEEVEEKNINYYEANNGKVFIYKIKDYNQLKAVADYYDVQKEILEKIKK